jgi:uncharacterized protein
MRSKLLFGVVALGVSTLVGACRPSNEDLVPLTLSQAGHRLEIRAEVAATPGARARGLMGRREVPAGRGMLFLFPGEPQRRGFWMKGTLVPLDVAFVRSRRVTEIRSMVPCRADPCPTTTSSQEADSALELPAGSLAEAGVGPGARVAFRGVLPSPS